MDPESAFVNYTGLEQFDSTNPVKDVLYKYKILVLAFLK